MVVLIVLIDEVKFGPLGSSSVQRGLGSFGSGFVVGTRVVQLLFKVILLLILLK